MSEIKTFQDGTPMGTFSQINLDDGNKILISLTQTEIAIFKVGFMGAPKGMLWKADIFDYIDKIYAEENKSGHVGKYDKTVLEKSVELAIEYESLEEVLNEFNKLMSE